MFKLTAILSTKFWRPKPFGHRDCSSTLYVCISLQRPDIEDGSGHEIENEIEEDIDLVTVLTAVQPVDDPDAIPDVSDIVEEDDCDDIPELEMSMEQVSLQDYDGPFQSNYDAASFLHSSEAVQTNSNQSQEYINLTHDNSVKSKYEGMTLLEGVEPIEFENNRANEQINRNNKSAQSTNDMVSFLDNESPVMSRRETTNLLSKFGLTKFVVPPLLYRHPPPAIGRDDDLYKIKEILDNTLTKMGYSADPGRSINRILCGPDNKIGKSLLCLMSMDDKYRAFLPEFPLLHLRKSLITILFSAYKDAGLTQILQYMRDDKREDWKTLVSADHIDTATKHVKRLSLSLHLAFLVEFAKSLAAEEQECFLSEMESDDPSSIAHTWSSRFKEFLDEGSTKNATFALHLDMMKHCDSVVAISLAERLGGPTGYSLLLAAVKESLPFLFVNSATSYAPYCVRLLFHNYSAGFFHTCLKETLFTTPIKLGKRNFACDTKRELDHVDAVKGFRSATSLSAVTSRMSLIDTLNEVKQQRTCKETKDDDNDDDSLGWILTAVDEGYIFPAVDIILRKGGLSTEENQVPFNVYAKDTICLPVAILDRCSEGTGEYLMYRFLARERLYGITEQDVPSAKDVVGPSELVLRAKRNKGITIKRTVKSKVQLAQTQRQMKETQRLKDVARETKLIDCLSSENNACQSLLKPDSSKPKVMKAIGMQRALRYLITSCMEKLSNKPAEELNIDAVMNLNKNKIPKEIVSSMKLCTFEFAGMKFKTGNIKSGKEYIQLIEAMVQGYLSKAPYLNKMIICEEKYSFTPDDLKAATREQRKSKTSTVDHLKAGSDIINDKVFNKDAATKTANGKRAISTYVASNLQSMTFIYDFDLVVDSELYLTSCDCKEDCSCEKFCTPIQRTFCKLEESVCNPRMELLRNIHQTKGEAEMSILDWLISLQEELKDGETVVSIITSGDIDAEYSHIYTVAKYWNRNAEGKFRYQVFVILQKQRGKHDIYNITAMLQIMEESFQDQNIGIKVALALCLGGNDFYPKSHQISHETVVKEVTENPQFRQNLFNITESISIDKQVLIQLYKALYCPKKFQGHSLSYENVRALTIGKKDDESKKGGFKTNNPRRWLPPESVVDRLGELFQLQIDYYETAGKHDAKMPDFLGSSCLTKTSAGEVEYDFGPEAKFKALTELPDVKRVKKTTKRQLNDTPQRGARRKHQLIASTPKKSTFTAHPTADNNQ